MKNRIKKLLQEEMGHNAEEYQPQNQLTHDDQHEIPVAVDDSQKTQDDVKVGHLDDPKLGRRRYKITKIASLRLPT